MPAVAPYIPNRDSLLDAWLANFSTLLTANPLLYGCTAGQATNVASAVSAWHTAYLATTSPSTKTATTVQTKNTQRVTCLAIVRPIAQQIANAPGVTSANKIALGLNPKTSAPQAITAPTTYPVLNVQGAAALQLHVRYRDSAASPSVKAKPYGVQSVAIAYATSATVITDPTALTQRVNVTRSPLLLQFGAGDGGKQCYLAAQYLCRNGKVSGWGPMVSFTVPQAL